jgi:hypothetical protein
MYFLGKTFQLSARAKWSFLERHDMHYYSQITYDLKKTFKGQISSVLSLARYIELFISSQLIEMAEKAYKEQTV